MNKGKVEERVDGKSYVGGEKTRDDDDCGDWSYGNELSLIIGNRREYNGPNDTRGTPCNWLRAC